MFQSFCCNSVFLVLFLILTLKVRKRKRRKTMCKRLKNRPSAETAKLLWSEKQSRAQRATAASEERHAEVKKCGFFFFHVRDAEM